MTNPPLTHTHPQLAQEWQHTNHPTATPHNTTKAANIPVTWKCQTCGWERTTTVRARTKNGKTGCAVCTNRIIIPGINDVATTHPHYLTWWHPNNTTTPQQVTHKSNKTITFQCPTNPEHTFTKKLYNFTPTCPTCKQASHTLTHTHPHLAAQWDHNSPTNNGKNPDTITYGSRFKAAWKCDNGHGWEATINSRTNNNTGCPTCANKTITPGINDVATTHPDIYAWWADTTHTPETIHAGSETPITFQCPTNPEHTFTRPLRRFNYTCPHCTAQHNNRTYTPARHATTLHEHSPHVAAQWDHTSPLNTGRTPHAVSFGSAQKAAWKCEKGHTWTARIGHRATKNTGCPYCANRKTLVGYNDVATTHPDILTWWHPNNTTTPQQVTRKSSKKILFQCPTRHHTFTKKLSKFVFECPQCATTSKSIQRFATQTQKNLIDEWHPNNPPMDSITYNSAQKVQWVCQTEKCGTIWETPAYQRVNQNTGCPSCARRSTSPRAEESLVNHFINTHGFIEGVTILRHSRPATNSNLEADIYFPEHKLAVEHNGLYWHSDNNRPNRNAHKHKYETFKNAGIQLVQIWEDDYLRAPGLVHTMIAHKLGVSRQETVGARKLTTTPITYTQATTFLDSNHIQGGMRGTFYLALTQSDGTIRAVSVWRKNHNQLYLERYATNARIPGGLGKLLKHVTTEIAPTLNIQRIVTFADHLVSDGTLYERLGFTADKTLKVDYQYVVNNKRAHKFNYRIRRFKDDPNLLFEEGLTETQLAQLNNLPRIWDAGKTRYVLDL